MGVTSLYSTDLKKVLAKSGRDNILRSMSENEHLLTEERKKELEEELHERKTSIRSGILERLAFAKSLGDLSENAEYHSSKDEQGKNEARISQIEAILKDTVIITANSDGTVGVGSRVTLLKNDTETQVNYHLVGPEEANFSQGKISFDSPIGKAVMGKKQGDEVKVSTPRGEVIYSIELVE